MLCGNLVHGRKTLNREFSLCRLVYCIRIAKLWHISINSTTINSCYVSSSSAILLSWKQQAWRDVTLNCQCFHCVWHPDLLWLTIVVVGADTVSVSCWLVCLLFHRQFWQLRTQTRPIMTAEHPLGTDNKTWNVLASAKTPPTGWRPSPVAAV